MLPLRGHQSPLVSSTTGRIRCCNAYAGLLGPAVRRYSDLHLIIPRITFIALSVTFAVVNIPYYDYMYFIDGCFGRRRHGNMQSSAASDWVSQCRPAPQRCFCDGGPSTCWSRGY